MADDPQTPPVSAPGGPDTAIIDSLQERLLELERQVTEKDAELAALTEQVQDAPLSDDDAAELAVLRNAGVGSSFLKERGGNWRVSFVTEQGTVLYLSGPSLVAAWAGHGQQHVVHPLPVPQ